MNNIFPHFKKSEIMKSEGKLCHRCEIFIFLNSIIKSPHFKLFILILQNKQNTSNPPTSSMFGYCLSYSMFCMGVYLRWLILMIHQMPPQEYRGCSEDRCSLIQNVLHFNVMLNKYLMLSSCKAKQPEKHLILTL